MAARRYFTWALTLATSILMGAAAEARSADTDYFYRGPSGEGHLVVQETGPTMGTDPPVTAITVTLEINGLHLVGRGYKLDEEPAGTRTTSGTRISFELHGPYGIWEFEGTIQGPIGNGKAYSVHAPSAQSKWYFRPTVIQSLKQ